MIVRRNQLVVSAGLSQNINLVPTIYATLVKIITAAADLGNIARGQLVPTAQNAALFIAAMIIFHIPAHCLHAAPVFIAAVIVLQTPAATVIISLVTAIKAIAMTPVNPVLPLITAILPAKAVTA